MPSGHQDHPSFPSQYTAQQILAQHEVRPAVCSPPMQATTQQLRDDADRQVAAVVERQVADAHAAKLASQAELATVQATAAAEREAALAQHTELQHRFAALQQAHGMR